MGKVKDVSSISNMHIILLKEGFPGVKLSYLGGLWLLIEFDNGSVRDKFLSHTGVKSWFCNIQLASHDFVCDERIVWVDIEGVPLKMWSSNTFVRIAFRLGSSFHLPKDTEYTSDDESIHNNGNTSEGQHNIGNDFNLDSEVEEVADTIFEDKPESPVNNECHSRDKEGDILSPDPFELYDLLNKHPNKSEKELDPSLSHPPGFTPEASRKEDINIEDAPIVENDKEGSSTAQSKPEDCYVNEVINDNSTSSRPEAHKGGSILGLLDDLIRIGQSMGYEMEGCIKDIGNIIEAQGDETKLDQFHMDVKYMWGNSNFQFVSSNSVGYSGGILCIWESNIFKKTNVTISDNFIALYGNWCSNNLKVLIVVIYTPQSIVRKRVLWEYITLLISRWDGETIVIGDFNEVRSIDERFGSVFNGSSARHFNRFIETSGLTDVNLEGYAFTWSHPSRSKMSKLDRFLISDGNLSSFPSMSALCLDRHLSDHRPILLREVFSDFGPIPFRVFHSWFKREGFDAMVEQAWNSFSFSDRNQLIRFKKKLQGLKVIIRRWIKDMNLRDSGSIESAKVKLAQIDINIDNGNVSDDILLERMELSRIINDFKHLEATDRIQKAKLKWAIEGDENSKFFHGIINKKRSQLSIRGVINDGQWHTDPEMVKDAFMRHFANRFKQPGSARLKINVDFPNRLSIDQTERYWSFIGPDFCLAVEWFFDKGSFPIGSNASFIVLIPKVADAKFVADFRPISLIGSVYKVVTKILANRLATVTSDLVSDTQTAFVANRQILDGPFILNELLSWCKRKKKQAMTFKVDFEKAYDSVRWDYLMDVLHAFGFGPNWCKWISGTRSSSMASVLVNGSPSSEFPLFRGLKQASGLKINIHKSQIMGVGVHRNLVSQAATIIGCSVMHAPFRYLGVMVGDCMTRLSAWSDSLQKLHQRLSKWKDKTLSIGGRLTLLKSVLGASPIYNLSIFKAPVGILKDMERIRSNFFKGADLSDRKISWVAWDKALASKKSGGLGISSYFALNRALLLKWVWRFISQDGSLWFRVIQSLYGSNLDLHSVQIPSIWSSILREVNVLNSNGFNFGRIAKMSRTENFEVKEVRSYLDNIFASLFLIVPTSLGESLIPIKINIFAWRARLDRLPTRSNLACRGIVMDSVLCPICGSDTETISHILFRCNLGVHIFRKICRWWEVDWLDVSSYDALALSGSRNKLLFDDSPPRQATLFDDIVSPSAATVETSFVVDTLTVNRLCQSQVITAVNRSLPGPTLRVKEGDTLIVHVFNRSPYNLTIHWHGVFQRLTQWADGPEFITQCPIRPGATVYGALIIQPRYGQKYPFVRPFGEETIMLGEWWNANPIDVESTALASGAAPVDADAYTFNGWPGDLFNTCVSTNTYRLNVWPGKTYLLRIINAALNTQFFFKIANHSMTVVGADAAYTNPYQTDVLVLGPGQTHDVLMTANQSPGLYYMTASPYATAAGVTFNQNITTGIIAYQNARQRTQPVLPIIPAFNDTTTAFAFSSNLTSLVTSPFWSPVPRTVDENMFMTIGLGLSPCNSSQNCSGFFGQRLSSSMNNRSFVLPSQVSLLEAVFRNISGVYTTDFPDTPPLIFDYTNANNSFNQNGILFAPKLTSVKRVKYNATVQVVFQNTALIGAENHPMHLHGMNFYVLAQGFGNYNPATDSQKFNLVNPQERNTLGVPVGGWAVIRFRANNPGVWYVHCHLDVHLPWGLAMAFLVENGVDTSLIHIESHKSPTAELFDVDSGRISIATVNTKEYHYDVLVESQG
ncbi:RNA-directed DNA polymerase, eukaryota [Tanacetum coccineum]